MTREMSRWGVGPSILLPMAAYAAVAGLATWLWPEVVWSRRFHTRFSWWPGSHCWLSASRCSWSPEGPQPSPYDSDKLATTGIFGLTRNPIYSAWIVFIIPGLVLLSRSWPLFLTPFVAFVVFKARIGREDEYLERHFGDEYRTYKVQVNEVVPFPRRK